MKDLTPVVFGADFELPRGERVKDDGVEKEVEEIAHENTRR